MLNERVTELKGEKKKQDNNQNLQPLVEVATTIDDNYVSDEELKIEIHKKINSIDSYDSLTKVKEELEDRFGKISDELIIYMHEEWFEKKANALNITKIKQTRNFIEVTLPRKLTEQLNGDSLFMKVNDISRMFRFKMMLGELTIVLDTVKLEKHFIYYLIDLMDVIENSLKK